MAVAAAGVVVVMGEGGVRGPSAAVIVPSWSLRDTAVKETKSEHNKHTARVTPKVFIIVSFILLLYI